MRDAGRAWLGGVGWRGVGWRGATRNDRHNGVTAGREGAEKVKIIRRVAEEQVCAPLCPTGGLSVRHCPPEPPVTGHEEGGGGGGYG